MLLNELFEVSQDLVSRYKTAAIKDVDKAIAAKAAGTMGRDEYERKMTKRGRGTAAAQRRLTPQGTRLDLTPHGDAIQQDYDRYRTDEQGVAEDVGSEEQMAEQTLQKLVSFARDNPTTTMAQLASSPLKNRITAALSACDLLIRSYTNAKQLGNAEFVRQLKQEINYFLTEKPPASSDPLDFGDLLTGKLGKINFQQGVAEGRTK
jgi:hypothetical protein